MLIGFPKFSILFDCLRFHVQFFFVVCRNQPSFLCRREQNKEKVKNCRRLPLAWPPLLRTMNNQAIQTSPLLPSGIFVKTQQPIAAPGRRLPNPHVDKTRDWSRGPRVLGSCQRILTMGGLCSTLTSGHLNQYWQIPL